MFDQTTGIRLFALVQGVVLVAVVVAIYLRYRRDRAYRDALEVKLENIDVRPTIRRTPTPESGRSQEESAAASEQPTAELGSAFPSWTKETPAHEVLGVSPQSDAETVEAAYKNLLKRYHPDRFASWGKGYQTRAHHVVLLLQEARDRLLR